MLVKRIPSFKHYWYYFSLFYLIFYCFVIDKFISIKFVRALSTLYAIFPCKRIKRKRLLDLNEEIYITFS